MARRKKAMVSILEMNIRRAWQRMAEEAGLCPAAAFWRWKALEAGKTCYWLKQSWESEKRPREK